MQKKESLWHKILRAAGDESPIMAMVGRIMLLVVMNLCLLIACIPVITGGAALIALYTVFSEKGQWNYVTAVPRFFKVLRQRLTDSLPVWLLTLAGVGALGGAWYIVLSRGWTDQFVLMLPLLLATAAILLTALWLYPLMACTKKVWKQAVTAAFLLALRELGRSLLLLAAEAAMAALAVWCFSESLTMTGIWFLGGIAPIEALKFWLVAGKLPKTE